LKVRFENHLNLGVRDSRRVRDTACLGHPSVSGTALISPYWVHHVILHALHARHPAEGLSALLYHISDAALSRRWLMIRSHRRLWYLDSPPYPQQVQLFHLSSPVSTYILVGARFCLKVLMESKRANSSVKHRPKTGQNCSREGQSGATEIQFFGFYSLLD
jgi:hypothetical protein